ncbi:MAG: CHAT domain-containing protein [Chloroflexi bacterium]|nr:CHAT domain-containing protein [Chloroflexota bacterium]
MESLQFTVSPTEVLQRKRTSCKLFVHNPMPSRVMNLRVSLTAASPNIILRTARIEFPDVPANGKSSQEILIQGIQPGQCTIQLESIKGMQKGIFKTFPNSSIMVQIQDRGPQAVQWINKNKLLKALDYLDCHLQVSRFENNTYRTKMFSDSGLGEAFCIFDHRNLANLLAVENFQYIDHTSYGKDLYDLVFNRDQYALYTRISDKADAQNMGIRLRLHIDAPELYRIRWELLYDSHVNEFMCLQIDTPVTHYLDTLQMGRPVHTTKPLKILGIAISPKDLLRLDLNKEKQLIDEAVKSLSDNGDLIMEWSDVQTFEQFRREAYSGDWNMLHFIGHSEVDQNQGGVLCFAKPNGESDKIKAADFAAALRANRSCRFVFLNSCSSAKTVANHPISNIAYTLLQVKIPAVIGMQSKITDSEAIELARTFYAAITDGLPIDAALTTTRLQLKGAFPNSISWTTPALFMRSKDGNLFEF